MLLAQISDTHFRSHGQKLYGFIDVNAANADVVSQLNALTERPDAVVVSGDIVNCGPPAGVRGCPADPRQPELSAVSDPRQPRR
ncbi:3',5'-cyclic adenosine monophosphate phosphodiesterase CpdA [Raoultella planticola]|uniref:3',5'-cyclic adenosine monophosphate phosphodiesterase CpdA n=1 Tax=Raoultella planticola TaxID=575 RepID=A0A485ARP8_RAOPL|nr:3',5'-cyclic adenosine monophosphate phosphodiesterase CpdA [Raoultella planticola]